MKKKIRLNISRLSEIRATIIKNTKLRFRLHWVRRAASSTLNQLAIDLFD